MHLFNTTLHVKSEVSEFELLCLLGHHISSDIKSKGNRSMETKCIEMYITTVLIINLSIKKS